MPPKPTKAGIVKAVVGGLSVAAKDPETLEKVPFVARWLPAVVGLATVAVALGAIFGQIPEIGVAGGLAMLGTAASGAYVAHAGH